MQPLRAILFDMDGTLIDSEPLWREAQVEVYPRYGMDVTYDMLEETMGMRVDEIVEYWMEKFGTTVDVEEVVLQVNERALGLILEKGEPRVGVEQALFLVKEMGYKMAVASSSDKEVMEKILDKLGVTKQFDLIHSAQKEIHGKPHPAVYLATAKALGVEPSDCVVVEDSVNGVLSAKAAHMKCIAVPGVSERNRKEFKEADIVLNSLVDLNREVLQQIIQ